MNERTIKVKLSDKPNLTKLYATEPATMKMILSTMIQMAEKAADPDTHNRIPWYKLPFMLNEKLTFATLVEALFEAMFEVPGMHPDNFAVMGADIHPLAKLQRKFDEPAKDENDYTNWRRHFDLPDDAVIDKTTLVEIMRKIFYYTRFIPVKEFGQAHLSRQLEAHKAIPELAVEKLPFVPALRYQMEHFKPLQVGRFWKDVGAFYGGSFPADSDTYDCPACKTHTVQKIGEYLVCPGCNIGFKEGEDGDE